MVVARSVISNDRQSIRFVESYACKIYQLKNIAARHDSTYRSGRRNSTLGDTRGRSLEHGISLLKPLAQQLHLLGAYWQVVIDGGHTRVQ